MSEKIFYEIPDEVEIRYLDRSKASESGVVKLLKLPFLALKYKKMLDSDVSVSFMNRPNYINVLAKLFGYKGKVVISERITPSMEYKTNSLKNIVNKFLIKILYKKADLLLPNSKYIAYDLSTFFNIPDNKIKTIYNLLSFEICNKSKNKEKNKSKTKRRFTFINIARLENQKNHLLLLKAFKKARLDANLWIVGDGSLREKIKKEIKNLNLEKKITLFGTQKNVCYFLTLSDCFVFSSNHEGFPNVLLEALACGLPVISTDCRSGPREILAPDTDFKKEAKGIEFAKYGILTPVGDEEKMAEAMRIIYENRELRESYAKKAKERAKDFRVEKIIREWEDVLSNI